MQVSVEVSVDMQGRPCGGGSGTQGAQVPLAGLRGAQSPCSILSGASLLSGGPASEAVHRAPSCPALARLVEREHPTTDVAEQPESSQTKCLGDWRPQSGHPAMHVGFHAAAGRPPGSPR